MSKIIPVGLYRGKPFREFMEKTWKNAGCGVWIDKSNIIRYT